MQSDRSSGNLVDQTLRGHSAPPSRCRRAQWVCLNGARRSHACHSIQHVNFPVQLCSRFSIIIRTQSNLALTDQAIGFPCRHRRPLNANRTLQQCCSGGSNGVWRCRGCSPENPLHQKVKDEILGQRTDANEVRIEDDAHGLRTTQQRERVTGRALSEARAL